MLVAPLCVIYRVNPSLGSFWRVQLMTTLVILNLTIHEHYQQRFKPTSTTVAFVHCGSAKSDTLDDQDALWS